MVRIVIACLAVLAWLPAHRAAAANRYAGIYTIIDPYNAGNVSQLRRAAAEPCTAANPGSTTPFCGATNGVLLRIGWCSFRLYHQTSSLGAAVPSCHYTVGTKSGSSGSRQIANTDLISPCPGTYDNCAGGTLATTMALIVQINGQRHAVGLAPLLLSVGLEAGRWTAQTVLDQVGFVDVPHTTSSSGAASKQQCFRLPLPWPVRFTNLYTADYDAMLSYLDSQMPNGANIAVLKLSGIAANDLEIEMSGRAQALSVPGDPGPAGPGGKLACSSTIPGAQTWLNAYAGQPVGRSNFSEAVESSFGTIAGHMWGTAANMGMRVLLSVPTTGAIALSSVGCGVSGGDACTVDYTSGNWSVYYMEKYIEDLFDGGVSYTAASVAYDAIRSDGFDLHPGQFSVNWTGLSGTTITPAKQTTCVLNNQVAANAPSSKLDGQFVTVNGVGTTIGWQTASLSGKYCASGSYGAILANGLKNGAQFLEIQNDAAFTDIAACSPLLAPTLTQLVNLTAPTTCNW